jgi:hypothetical protein
MNVALIADTDIEVYNKIQLCIHILFETFLNRFVLNHTATMIKETKEGTHGIVDLIIVFSSSTS